MITFYRFTVLPFVYTLVHIAEGFIAGGTAGVVVETALYPIDTIKTRLQVGGLYLRSMNCILLMFLVSLFN